MYCTHCGRQVNDGALFCDGCGAGLGVFDERNAPPREETGNRVTRCADGKYRWIYEMSLFKNPTIFFLIWKIFFFIIVGIFALMIIIDVSSQSGNFSDGFLGNLKIMGYILLGMTALVGISYLIYAAIMGGKYIVEFEMDDDGVRHTQSASQAKKARRIGQFTALTGAAAGNPGTVAAGLGAQRTEMYSKFSAVKRVKPYPKRNLIKVNGTLNHNQVYAAPEDFEFVKNFIISHCENLKK